jgi:hypothetical protein
MARKKPQLDPDMKVTPAMAEAGGVIIEDLFDRRDGRLVAEDIFRAMLTAAFFDSP